jgi:predicted PurR-regulated permease PerM
VPESWDSQRVARAILVVAVVAISAWMLRGLLPALAWACVLAIATWPARRALVRRRLGATAAATLLTVVLALVLVLPLVGLGVEAGHEGRAAADWARSIFKEGLGAPPGWLSLLPYVGDRAAAWWQTNLAQAGSATTLFGHADALIGHADRGVLLGFSRALGLEVADRLAILVFTLLTLFFLYRDGDSVAAEADAIAMRVFGPRGGELGRNAVAAIRGTVNGVVLVGLGEGALLGAAYAAVGLKHAVLLGLVTAVLSVIPFGASLVFVVGALFLFAQAQTTAAVALLIFGMLVVALADHLVRPLLIRSSSRLPFLWALLGIFAGLETFGLLGLFLGPAIMSVLIAMWREGAAPAAQPLPSA